MSATPFLRLSALLLVLYGISVADLVLGGPLTRWDATFSDAVRSLHTPTLDRLFIAISACGVWQVVATLFVLATIALAALRRFGLILGLWLTFAGKQATVAVLKDAFDRLRPHGASLVTASFPSNHAATSVAFYGLMFWLAWWLRLLPGPVAFAAGFIVAVAMGFSRVYLGEHWVTDVLNGYVVGALWLLVGAALCARWDDRRAAL